MKIKVRTFLTIFCIIVCTTFTNAQQFDNFQNIEKFISLTPKNLNSKLLEYGYTYDSKRTETKMMVMTFIKQKSDLTVNYGFSENRIVMFMWNDEIDKGANIVQNIEDNKNYIINESKTKDNLGVFYMQSKTSDLDIIIFRTATQMQNGKIGFNLFRNNEKNLSEINSNLKNTKIEIEESKEEVKVTTAINKKPEYIGGNSKMVEYISSNIDKKLIKKFKKEKSVKEFKTTIEFTVNEDGSVAVDNIKGVDSTELKAEIKEAFENMPKWNCGGIIVSDTFKPQKTKLTLPLTF